MKLSIEEQRTLVAKLRKAKQPVKAIAKVAPDLDPPAVFWDLMTRGALTLKDIAANDALFVFVDEGDVPSAAVLAYAKTLQQASCDGLDDVLPGLSRFVNTAIDSGYSREWDRATFAPRVRDAVVLASGRIPDADRERLLDELAAHEIAGGSRIFAGRGLEALLEDPSYAQRLARHLASGPSPRNLWDFPEVFAHLGWERIETLLCEGDLNRLGHQVDLLVKHRPETTSLQLAALAERMRTRITDAKQVFGPLRLLIEAGVTPGPEWDPILKRSVEEFDVALVVVALSGATRERVLELYDRTVAAAPRPGRRAWSYPLLGLAYDEARVRDAIETCVHGSNADYLGAIGPRAVPLLEAAHARATGKEARDHFRDALAVAVLTTPWPQKRWWSRR